MLRNLVIALVCASVASTAGAYASANNKTPVNLPNEFANTSKYRLDYSDLEAVLRGSVLEMGRSDHKRARKLARATGSNMRLGNPLPSRLEGNRVLLHEFGQAQLAGLAMVRDDLLAIPAQLAIEKLSKEEQLAYWLNLHNIIVLSKVASLYPVTMLESIFSPASGKSVLYDRDYEWNGQMISLADIQNHILTNWADPVVIYGFYLGAVGTPNIRNSAYTGANVHAALKDNAEDFVNSVRGTQVRNKTKLRVSTYYEAMAQKFPNFQNDLMTHIRKYATSELLHRMKQARKIATDIDDWHIADLYNGKLSSEGGSHAGTVTDRRGTSAISGLPRHVTDLLVARQARLAKSVDETGSRETKKESR